MAISFIFLIAALTCSTSASRILVVPYVLGYSTRFENLASLAELLAQHSHEVTLLTNDQCLPKWDLQNIEVISHPVPKDIPLPSDNMEVLLEMSQKSMINSNISHINAVFCMHFLKNQSIFPMLKSRRYDVLILDFANVYARILTDYLSIPTIIWSNWGFNLDDDLFYPIFPSFVASTIGPNGEDMSFLQRARNFWEYHIYNQFLVSYYGYIPLDRMKNSHGMNTSLSVKDSYKRIKPLIICQADMAFDYARPLMPHVIPISGLFLESPKPLVGEIKDFIDNSGPDGVILVSFGSLFSHFMEERSRLLAKVFARLPHRVIWRFSAPFSIETGNNTLLLPWLPQNDILAHNKTRLYITHCGIKSSYEAIFHSVPILGIPFISDQPHNCKKLTDRAKMGMQLNLFEFDDKLLESTIHQVISDKSFKANALRMKEYVLDKPQKPRDAFIYWVEYVIRHKGAGHLYSLPALNLSWYQYFCLDVIVMSIAAVAVTISATLLLFVCLLRVFLRFSAKATSFIVKTTDFPFKVTASSYKTKKAKIN